MLSVLNRISVEIFLKVGIWKRQWKTASRYVLYIQLVLLLLSFGMRLMYHIRTHLCTYSVHTETQERNSRGVAYHKPFRGIIRLTPKKRGDIFSSIEGKGQSSREGDIHISR